MLSTAFDIALYGAMIRQIGVIRLDDNGVSYDTVKVCPL